MSKKGLPKLIADEELVRLVELIKNSDSDAFTEFVILYQETFFGLLAAALRDTHKAEEVLQETFKSAWEYRANIQDASKYLQWMYRIAMNNVKKYASAQNVLKKRIERFTRLFPEHWFYKQREKSAEDSAITNEQVTKSLEALFSLPMDERIVFTLRYFSGNSISEIAELQNSSPNQVRHKLHSAKKKLAKYIETATIGALALLNFASPLPKLMADIQPERVTQAAATTAVATTGGTVFSAVAGKFVSLLLGITWILSFVTGLLFCGASLVENATTTQFRRWHTRNNFILYNILLASPLLFLGVGAMLPHPSMLLFFNIFLCCFAAVAVLYAARAIRSYVMISNQVGAISFPHLSRLIRNGFVANSIFLFCCLVWITATLSINGTTISLTSWTYIALGGTCVLLYHGLAFRQFRRFLDMCKDDITTGKFDTEVVIVSTTKRLMITGMIFTIGPNMIHLIAYFSNPLYVILEIALFLGLWRWCYLRNKTKPEMQIERTGAVFFVQVLIMIIGRQLFY